MGRVAGSGLTTRMARCACEITSYDGQRVRGAAYASRIGVRSAGWRLRQRPPGERAAAEQAAAAGQATAAKVTAKVTAKVVAVDTAQKRSEPSAASSHGAIATPKANGGVKRGQVLPDLEAPLEVKAPAEAKVPLEGTVPLEVKAPLEAQVKALLQAGAPAEARALLLSHAEHGAPLTQFYLAVCVSQLEGEAAACEHYEASALKP